jgi:hypothetical protein
MVTSGGAAVTLPSGDFDLHRRQVGKKAIQALPLKHVQLDFGHV